MRAKQLAAWTNSTLFDVMERSNSDNRQTRDTIRKLFEWMDIHQQAQTEFRKQAKVR